MRPHLDHAQQAPVILCSSNRDVLPPRGFDTLLPASGQRYLFDVHRVPALAKWANYTFCPALIRTIASPDGTRWDCNWRLDKLTPVVANGEPIRLRGSWGSG